MGRLSRRRRTAVPLDSQIHFIALMKWMKQNDFKSSKLLKPADFLDTGRGMMAVKKIRSGDCLVSIPRKLLITTTTVLNSYLGPFVNMWTHPKLTPRQLLVIFLVFEKYCNVLSPWKPYLDTLPTSYSVPAFWGTTPSKTSAWLQQRIDNHIEEVREAYESCQPFVEQLGYFLPAFKDVLDYERFRWGWFTVLTRAVHLEQTPNACLAPERDHYALAPYLDLLNHSPYAKVKAAFNEETEHYEIITLLPCKKFHQVFINYGPRDNSTLLLDYGFVANDNPHNVVHFTMDDLYCAVKSLRAQEQPEAMHVQLQILGRQNLIRDLTCSLDGPSWNLLVVLRILLMKQVELVKWSLALQGTVSLQHQQAVRNCLHICLERKLGTYPPDDELHQLGTSTEVGCKLVSLLMKQEVNILKVSLGQIETQDCNEAAF